MKKTLVLLLLVLLVSLMGCQNSTIANNQKESLSMNTSEEQSDTAISSVKNNVSKNGHSGKIKIIETTKNPREFIQQTIERHEKAVNDFIKDKIVYDLDYSSYSYTVYDDFYNDNPYFKANDTGYEWGYSTQIYYEDIE